MLFNKSWLMGLVRVWIFEKTKRIREDSVEKVKRRGFRIEK